MRRVVSSARAKLRLDVAARWLAARAPDEQVLVVGANHAAAAELIREVARDKGSGFGWHRTTLGRLAAELAKLALAETGLVPVGMPVVEALCARVIYELGERGELGRLASVAEQPGLPRALARTLTELRMAGVTSVDDRTLTAALAALDRQLATEKLADRAAVFASAIAIARGQTASPRRLQTAADSENDRALATEKLPDRAAIAIQRTTVSPPQTDSATDPAGTDVPGNRDAPHLLLALPTILVDISIRSRLEQQLLAAVIAHAPDVLVTLPAGDSTTRAYLEELGLAEIEELAVSETEALGRVQRHLFDRGKLIAAALDPSLEIFSAPGESRECVELARRVVHAADSGVPFDRMAVVLRMPGQYRAHLEEALGRAGVPMYFEQGTVRPDPSGRAFLALLACAAEGFSARRFGEYVSLGEVPDAMDGAPPEAIPPAERWVAPDEELSPIPPAEPHALELRAVPYGAAVAGGTLRAPWRWEQLLVEAAVIGGRDRWERRLSGLQRRLELDDGRDGRAEESRARMLEDLGHLRRFALPLLDDLAALPHQARWGDWLDRLTALATRTLREPTRVLEVLSALVPMRDVGPVTLREVQLVLHPRLAELIVRPIERRYGKLLVVPVDAIRGLSLDVVFVPGLAERMFPQKVIEDPLLLDGARTGIELPTREHRIVDERLALRLAIGAASQRVVLSYPRIDLDQGRPRVPSFYGLEVLEAAEGELPNFDELGRKADATGASRIGWPAPADRMTAIDEAEHDLALLDTHLRPGSTAPMGVAAYLLEANPHLGRSLRFRARRWTATSWLQPDGLIAKTTAGKDAIAAHAIDRRSFSPTALEQLAQCPYRFALKTIVKLEPREQPEAIEALGPLERGSLIHDVHFELLGELREAGLLPIRDLESVRERIDTVLARVAARYRDDLCPAIDRVWDDGIAQISADVREWVRRMIEDPEWTPRRFELAFGPTRRGARDPASVDDAVRIDAGLALRGSIDLVEEGPGGALRATDYKTGRATARFDVVIGNGAQLQPVLYALVLEKLAAGRVSGGRLYYCTSRGEFRIAEVPLDQTARDAAKLVADTLVHHLDEAAFPAAPIKDGCTYCDYKLICGPAEELRVRPKLERHPLIQLQKLRSTR